MPANLGGFPWAVPGCRSGALQPQVWSIATFTAALRAEPEGRVDPRVFPDHRAAPSVPWISASARDAPRTSLILAEQQRAAIRSPTTCLACGLPCGGGAWKHWRSALTDHLPRPIAPALSFQACRRRGSLGEGSATVRRGLSRNYEWRRCAGDFLAKARRPGDRAAPRAAAGTGRRLLPRTAEGGPVSLSSRYGWNHRRWAWMVRRDHPRPGSGFQSWHPKPGKLDVRA